MSMFQILANKGWTEVMQITMWKTDRFYPIVAIYFIFYHLFVTLVSTDWLNVLSSWQIIGQWLSGGHWPAIRCSLVNQSCLQLQVDAMLPSFLSMVLLLCIRGFLLVVDVFNILGNLCDLCTIPAPVLYVMWQLSQSLLPKCIKYDSSALCIK